MTAATLWGDAERRVLGLVGHLPGHRLGNAAYRAAGGRLPASSAIHHGAVIMTANRLRIGEFTTVGDTAVLDAREGIEIGDCVNIGSHVTICTLQHDADDPDFGAKGGPVVVEDYAWLSSHSCRRCASAVARWWRPGRWSRATWRRTRWSAPCPPGSAGSGPATSPTSWAGRSGSGEGRAEALLVEGERLPGHRLPRIALGAGVGRAPQPVQLGPVVEQPLEGGGVAGRHDDAVHSGPHDLGRAGGVGGDRRQAAGHGVHEARLKPSPGVGNSRTW